uniref:AlNc14C139G7201 protein n=1 Tax=Albugo laibachii Nc14 TaxID=890382 RepID=F0WL12_9STRA|nr:AlNc14C139G7201 [Albugo laibachii Nc14]|eukprot:CCA21971.1 AlNc14C139G7201 [Albugo laibachii Nc14]
MKHGGWMTEDLNYVLCHYSAIIETSQSMVQYGPLVINLLTTGLQIDSCCQRVRNFQQLRMYY